MNLQGGSAAFLAQQAQRPGRDENACSRWQVRVADVFTGNSMVTAESSRAATLKHNPEICSNTVESNISKKENKTALLLNFLTFSSASLVASWSLGKGTDMNPFPSYRFRISDNFCSSEVG